MSYTTMNIDFSGTVSGSVSQLYWHSPAEEICIRKVASLYLVLIRPCRQFQLAVSVMKIVEAGIRNSYLSTCHNRLFRSLSYW